MLERKSVFNLQENIVRYICSKRKHSYSAVSKLIVIKKVFTDYQTE